MPVKARGSGIYASPCRTYFSQLDRGSEYTFRLAVWNCLTTIASSACCPLPHGHARRVLAWQNLLSLPPLSSNSGLAFNWRSLRTWKTQL